MFVCTIAETIWRVNIYSDRMNSIDLDRESACIFFVNYKTICMPGASQMLGGIYIVGRPRNI